MTKVDAERGRASNCSKGQVRLRRHGTLGSLSHAPGLPEVTTLVCRDDVKPRGKAEPYAADEGIDEAYSYQIDVGVLSQECAHFVLRGKKLIGRISERR